MPEGWQRAGRFQDIDIGCLSRWEDLDRRLYGLLQILEDLLRPAKRLGKSLERNPATA
jgi:hypothetical protein